MFEKYGIYSIVSITLLQYTFSARCSNSVESLTLFDKIGVTDTKNFQIKFVSYSDGTIPFLFEELTHYASLHFISIQSSIYGNQTDDFSKVLQTNVIFKSCKDITEIQTSIKQIEHTLSEGLCKDKICEWKPLIILELWWNPSYKTTEETLKQLLNPIPKLFTFDSEIYIITWRNGDRKSFEIYELYWSMQFSIVKNIHEVRDISTLTRRYNLQGDVVKYLFYVDKNLRFETSVLSQFDIMSAFSRRLNFSSVNVAGEDWIRILPNGSMSGMGKQLENGDGDIIIQHTDLTLERNKKLTFLLPLFHFRQRAYFRQPSKFFGDILLQPYSVGAWIGLITSLIVVGVVALVLNASGRLENITLTQVGNTMFHILSQLSQQGLETESFVLSTRIVTFLGFLLGTLYYNLYSGSILSIIAVQGPPIKTYEDLLTSGMYFLVDNFSTNPQDYIKNLPRKTSNILEQILPTQEGLLRLITGEYAFITPNFVLQQTATVALNITNDDFCQFNFFDFPLSSGSALYFRVRYMKKNSPFSKMFSFVELQLKERGVTYRDIVLTYLRINAPTCTKTQEPVTALTFHILSSVFLLYIVTATIAVVILIGEFIIKNQTYSNRRPFIRRYCFPSLVGIKKRLYEIISKIRNFFIRFFDVI